MRANAARGENVEFDRGGKRDVSSFTFVDVLDSGRGDGGSSSGRR